MNLKSTPARSGIRAALRIHEHLIGTSRRAEWPGLPEEAWIELQRTALRLQTAINRGWSAAATSAQDDLYYALQRLERDLASVRQELPPRVAPEKISSPGVILADLAALEDDFEQFSLELQQQTLSVLTDPIELDGLHLGAFRVVLCWSQIGQQRAYRVEAVDPSPANGYEGVTHPHVRDGVLCEGEGVLPIKIALAQGRLLDFFTLVRQILQTYNAESAHVALERWNGATCRDCGWRMSSDEQGICERCDASLCGDCSSSCQGCDRYVCSGCTSECTDCGSYYCASCLSTSADSADLVCTTCLESRLEDETHEMDEELPPGDSPAPHGPLSAVSAVPKADALCLGETAVPA